MSALRNTAESDDMIKPAWRGVRTVGGRCCERVLYSEYELRTIPASAPAFHAYFPKTYVVLIPPQATATGVRLYLHGRPSVAAYWRCSAPGNVFFWSVVHEIASASLIATIQDNASLPDTLILFSYPSKWKVRGEKTVSLTRARFCIKSWTLKLNCSNHAHRKLAKAFH